MARKICIAVLLTLVLFAVIALFNRSNKIKRMNDTISTALSYSQVKTVNATDTFREKIYGDFNKQVIAIRVAGKYGLYDTLTKKVISPVTYDEISSFGDEGAVPFKQGKKYGFLNDKGVEIVPADYDFTSGFSQGLAAVKLNEKWGYIDKSGKVIIPIEYDMAWDFNIGLGAVKKDWKWGFINKKGKYILKPKYDNITRSFDKKTQVANVSEKSHHYFIDRNGKYIKDSEPYKEFGERK